MCREIGKRAVVWGEGRIVILAAQWGLLLVPMVAQHPPPLSQGKCAALSLSRNWDIPDEVRV